MIAPLLAAALAVTVQVDLRLEPAAFEVPAGTQVTVELVASSAQPEVLTAVDAILAWDPARLTLLSGAPGDLPPFVAGFLPDPDGINVDVTDGEALWTALTPPTTPGVTPPDMVVARFDVLVLRSGCIELVPAAGGFGKTRVIGPVPGVEVTGAIGGPALIEVPGAFTVIGGDLAGTGGLVPALTGDGALLACDPWSLELSAALPGTTAWLVLGLSPLGVPLKGGVLVPSPDILTPVPTGPAGIIALSGSWPDGLPAGLQAWLQWWVVDPGGPVGFAASNGLIVTTP